MKHYLEPTVIGRAYPTPSGDCRCFDGKTWHDYDKYGNIIDRKTKRRK